MDSVKIDQKKTEKQCIDHNKDQDHNLYDIAAAFVEVFHRVVDHQITSHQIRIFMGTTVLSCVIFNVP